MAEKTKKLKESTASTREEKINEIISKLEKDFGKGTVIGATDKPKYYDHISTGSLGLDKALGIGGLPRGRIVEIYGPESSGKTTMATHVMAEAQKLGDNVFCAYVDAEHAFDIGYAEKIGVVLDRLKISQPDYGEQALEVTEKLAESGEFDVIVVDSVAALVPKAEKEKKMGESSMGKHAMLMSQAMRKLAPVAAKSNTLIIFINQLRDKIGVMFGSPETTTGGNALKFYASVRLDVRRSLKADNMVVLGEEKVGNQTTVKVAKNKTAPPFKQAQFDILYGVGVDKYGETLDMGIACGVLTKSGAYAYYNSKSLGQGRVNICEFFKNNPEIYQEIKKKVEETYVPIKYEETED